MYVGEIMIIKYDDLKEIRKNKRKIGVCTGCFDLLHTGHLCFFEEVKKHCDILVVVVLDDSKIKEIKEDNRPIINQQDRIKLLDSLKVVDYVILADQESDVSDYQKYNFKENETFFWKSYGRIFEDLRPDILGVSNQHHISEAMKIFFHEMNIEICTVNLLDNLSTTCIINKIKKINI